MKTKKEFEEMQKRLSDLADAGKDKEVNDLYHSSLSKEERKEFAKYLLEKYDIPTHQKSEE